MIKPAYAAIVNDKAAIETSLYPMPCRSCLFSILEFYLPATGVYHLFRYSVRPLCFCRLFHSSIRSMRRRSPSTICNNELVRTVNISGLSIRSIARTSKTDATRFSNPYRFQLSPQRAFKNSVVVASNASLNSRFGQLSQRRERFSLVSPHGNGHPSYSGGNSPKLRE